MGIWKYISNIGCNAQLDEAEQRRIRLLSQLNFICAVVLAVYVIAQIFVGVYWFFPAIAVMVMFIIIDMWLLKIRLYAIAKHFAVLTVSCSISFFSLTTGDTYSEALFIPLITMPLLVFRSKKSSIFYFVLILLLIVGIKIGQKHVTPLLELNSGVIYFFRALNTLIAAAVTYFITFYFKSANERYEQKLVDMHDTVAEKNKEITDSIKYAKRIQESLMPPEKYIE
ncbi:MAG: hypothetical protein JNL69_03915, partial [Bacteroidia bacterium]|nr:hypothetical protein [Bacteroidia bacterium]